MGQTGFCKILRFPAVFCENLRFSCENLCLLNAVIHRKSENQQKSAKIFEKLQIQLRNGNGESAQSFLERVSLNPSMAVDTCTEVRALLGFPGR